MAALDGLDAERGGQVGLAGADRADEHDVSCGGDPRAACEILNARPLETVGAPPVELRERLSRGKTGGLQPALDGVLGAGGDFCLEQSAQKRQRMLPVGERLARERLGLTRDARQFEHAAVRAGGREHDVGFVRVAHAEHLAASSKAS